MKKFSIFFMFVLICINFQPLSADQCSNIRIEKKISQECSIVGNKVYIQPQQLQIVNEGIFLHVQNEKFLIQQLNFDEKGIYCWIELLSDRISDECYNQHKIWCWTCLGCVVRYCPFRCKCVEWDF